MKNLTSLLTVPLIALSGLVLVSCASDDPYKEFEDDRKDYYDSRDESKWERDGDIREAEMDLKEQWLKETR